MRCVDLKMDLVVNFKDMTHMIALEEMLGVISPFQLCGAALRLIVGHTVLLEVLHSYALYLILTRSLWWGNPHPHSWS